MNDNPLVVRLHGDYDIYRQDEFRRTLDPAQEHDAVIVDFSSVGYIDSTAISILVLSMRKRQTRGFRPTAFAGVSENVRTVLHITGLDHVWPMFETVEEAADHLRLDGTQPPQAQTSV